MDSIKIATFGRLSDDLSHYVNKMKDDHIICHQFNDAVELANTIKNYNVFAGFSINENLDISHLKWIHSFGAGVDGILSNGTISDSCLITKTLGNMDQKIAQYSLSHILADLNNVIAYRINQNKKEWKHLSTKSLLNDLNILIMGTGFIGIGIAKLLSSTGSKINGINTKGHPVDYFNHTYSHISEVECSTIDVIINTLPLTDKTNCFYNTAFFKYFKDVLFINVGRGESVTDQDLLDALEIGYLRKAVLDVFRKEPLPSHHQFWHHDKIIVTPHIAAKTLKDEMIPSFMDALKIFKGKDYEKDPVVVDKSKGY